jgi:tripartite ATP-independent transporter DctM subunit
LGWLGILWATVLLLGMPVAFTLGVSALLYIWWADMPMIVMAQRMAGGLDSFPLLAVPFFILAANLMNTAGITDRLFAFATVLVGRLRGGLAQVNIMASIIFSGMSGSAVADAGGLGAMEIKAMRQAGYTPAFAAALTAASCVIGPMIPPSIPMVIYGVIADASVGRLFLGGVVPGLLAAGSLMLMIALTARRKKMPEGVAMSLSESTRATRRAILPMFTPVIIIGGILFGVFSPTEASAIACIYALFLGLFYRQLTLSKIWTELVATARTTGAICLIVSTATLFAWLLTTLKVPQNTAAVLVGVTDSPLVLLLLISAVVFVVGFFLEGLAIMILIVPVMLPTLTAVGVDPIHFGVVLVFNLMIGLMTPPMGVGLFVVSSVSGERMEAIAREVFPMLVPLVIVLLLLIVFPPLVTALPDAVLGPAR